tara:strand:- start:538 stop:906 length:369 start_codon:yes stop_codon:yes gene_type:complete
MSFSLGQSVMYNSKCCTVFKKPGKRIFGNVVAGYLVRENESGTTHDNVAESSLTACNCAMICNDCWSNFTYTGDNKAASQWVLNCLVKHLNGTGNLEWGHNSDNTQYFFKMGGTTWTKDKSD